MQRLDHNDVAHRLLNHVRSLVDGNHVSASDLRDLGQVGEDYGVDAHVVWRFSAETSSRTVLENGACADTHHGFDRDSLDQAVQTLCKDAAFNREVREAFTQRVASAGAAALAWADQSQTIQDYGEHSVHRHCSVCSGGGQINCSHCGGKGRKLCLGCGGGGSQMRHHTHWDAMRNEARMESRVETCSGCGGSGRVMCFFCRGNGRQQCHSCHGQGFFTDIIRVTAVAVPSWHVRADSGLASEVLQSYLQQAGAAESAEHIPFDLTGAAHEADDGWVARYRGIASIVELHCELEGRRYDITAVGQKPHPVRRPPIFDQIFADEIADLRQLNHAKSGNVRIKGFKARRMFADFCRQPVLDRALQAVAALEGDDRKRPEGPVMAAAEGFISSAAAHELGIGTLGMLHKVSPPYSVSAWWMVLGLPVVAAFFATEYVAERTINWMGWLVTAVVMLIAAPLVIALLSPLAWSMSALVSSARRRGIPAAYRQKGRNWEPQKYVYGGAVAAVVLGVLYGGTVSLGWLPPLSQASTLTAQWISERAQTLPKVRSWFAPQTVPAKYDQPPSNLPALPEEPTVRNAE